MRSSNRCNPVIAVLNAWWLSHIAGLVRAFQYGCAAEREVRDGFPYTAAMDWRKAAGLFPANTRAAGYCWRQWERIMQLPRRLAGPFGASPVRAVPPKSASTKLPAREPAIDQVSFANAA